MTLMSERPSITTPDPDQWIFVASSKDRAIEAPVNRTRLVARVVLIALAVAVVVMLLGVVEARQLAGSLAVSGAEKRATILATDVIEPEITEGVANSDAQAIGALDSVVKTHVLTSDIARVKIWNAEGTVLYSDEPRLIGRSFALTPAQRVAFSSGDMHAGLADLTAPENRYDRAWGPLLVVQKTVHAPNGTPMLVEFSYNYDDLMASSVRIWGGFAVITGISLLLLTLALLPLLRRLVRRLERSQAQREQLLMKAIDASDRERRRIAAMLHDGPVQDLVGAGYRIGAAATAVHGTVAGDTLEEAESTMRATVQSLRALLVDIYPATLSQSGLTIALQDLAAGARSRGALVTVQVDAGVRLRPEAEHLVFRIARETIANATKHSGGAPIHLTLRPEGERVMLTVRDHGPGFDAEHLLASPKANHFGLRLLQDAVEDSGIEAELRVCSTLGKGTTWVLRCTP